MRCQVAPAGPFLIATPPPPTPTPFPSGLIPHLAGGSAPKPGDERGLIPEHQSITLRPGPRWRRQDGRQVSSCLQSVGVVNHASSRPASPHMCFIFRGSTPHPPPAPLFFSLFIFGQPVTQLHFLRGCFLFFFFFFLRTVWSPDWNHIDGRRRRRRRRNQRAILMKSPESEWVGGAETKTGTIAGPAPSPPPPRPTDLQLPSHVATFFPQPQLHRLLQRPVYLSSIFADGISAAHAWERSLRSCPCPKDEMQEGNLRLWPGSGEGLRPRRLNLC